MTGRQAQRQRGAGSLPDHLHRLQTLPRAGQPRFSERIRHIAQPFDRHAQGPQHSQQRLGTRLLSLFGHVQIGSLYAVQVCQLF